jgi:macrolide-specific efflux system membrane fusion protein
VNNVTTYQVDVVPSEAPDFMKSGMTANVSFLIESHNQVFTIPAEAIQRKSDSTFVLVPDPKGKVAGGIPQEVELGLSDGKKTEVISGLTENDTVLVPVWTIPDAAKKGSNPFMPQFGKRNPGRGTANGSNK